MKRILLLLVGLVVVLVACGYLFFPSHVSATTEEGFSCTQRELQVCLHDPSKWLAWVPDSAANRNDILSKQGFTAGGVFFRLRQKLSNGADFDISYYGKTFASRLEALSLRPDSLLVSWKTDIVSNGQLFQRFHLLADQHMVLSSMQQVLKRLQSFSADNAHIYGYPIVRTNFEDSFLIAVRKTFSSPPGVAEVYSMVNSLKDYLRSQGAKATDAPMLHVQEDDSSHYRAMVAIATDRILPDAAPFFMIRMMHMEGKFVRADVIGGPGKLKEAHKAIESYMIDHTLTSPGIPFEILVTDRSQQADTSKWVTKVYHPST